MIRSNTNSHVRAKFSGNRRRQMSRNEQNDARYNSQKNSSFQPPSPSPRSDSAKNFIDLSLSWSIICVPSFVQIDANSEEIYANVSSSIIIVPLSAWNLASRGISPTIIPEQTLHLSCLRNITYPSLSLKPHHIHINVHQFAGSSFFVLFPWFSASRFKCLQRISGQARR